MTDTITIQRGTSWARDVDIYSDSTRTTPENLTGGTVTFDVYDAPGGNHLFAGTTEIDPDPATGKVLVSLAPDDTDLDDYSVLYGVIRYNDANGNNDQIEDMKLLFT